MSDKLMAAVAESASALTLHETTHVSSSEELLQSSEERICASTGTTPRSTTDGSLSSSPFSEELVAGAADSAPPQTLQEPDAPSLELLNTATLEASMAASPRTAPHNNIDGDRSVSTSTTDGSSNFSPFRLEKFMSQDAESASAQTLQEPDVSSSEELIHTTSSEELSTASPSTVLHDAADVSQPSASPVGPPILFRDPPNWYQEFYLRTDCKGHFHMYPDLGGPFESLQEAEAAINRHLNERRIPNICQKPSEGPLLEWRIKQCLYYPDGTPKRGPKSPARKNPYDPQRQLVKALLDQYNDYHNLSKDLAHELKDLVGFQWIFENRETYYHFNFTTKTEADDGNLFFAEVWEVQTEDAWVVNCCCEIKANDNGLCYGCRRNRSKKLWHPNNTRAYIGGHVDGYLPFGGDDCSDDDEDDEAYEARLRFMLGDQ